MAKRTFQKLSDKPSMERWKYAVELGKHGKDAVDLLISCLKDDDKWVRCLVIDALGNIRNPRVVNPPISVLRDLDQDVRFMAAEAMGRVGGAPTLEALEKTRHGG